MGEASIPLPRSLPPWRPRRLLSDGSLARLAAHGDQRAFAAIYGRHHQALYRYCRSILRNDEDARDALQSTMVRALDALRGERRHIELKPWLFRIAHNEAITLVRRREPQGRVEEIEEIAGPDASDPGTRERLGTLISDLRHIPERQRSALVMRELSGLTYEEIGSALATSAAAAKQAVYEARTGLHQLAEGREMECVAARRSISANDRRVLRGRTLRAHLRSCRECSLFETAVRTHRTDLAALAPPLPAGVAAALLEGVAGAGPGGAAGTGLIGLLGGAGGKSAAGSAALKATTALVTVGVGVGVSEYAEHPRGSSAGAGRSSSGAPPNTGEAETFAGGGSKDHGSSRAAERDLSHGPGGNVGASQPGNPGPGADGETKPGAGSNPGESSGAPSNGLAPTDVPPPSQPAAPPAPVEPGAPEQGTPPAQGGTPPGLDGETPPGHGGTPPGLGGVVPPGHGGIPPGQGGTPPGQTKPKSD